MVSTFPRDGAESGIVAFVGGYRGNRQGWRWEGVTMTKTWLITGSSRGFGRELTKAVLASGHQAVATARRPERLDDLVRQYGDLLRTAPLDVTDPAAAVAAVQLAIDAFGALDVVVNNAGYAVSAPIEAMTLDDFRAQIEANLFGVVNVTKAALPVLHKQRSGHFIQFSSIGGRVGGTPGMGAYQTAKFGVEGFSEVLRNEVKPLGIKVTIIEPGAFRTDWGGSSMTAVPVSADYDQTVGEMNRYRESTVSAWPGDPARAAKIITDLAGLDEPPTRLLLGAGAVESAREASEQRAAEAEMWADVSRSADFPAGQ
jgi:NAD(P)-dependent dehydrogenase (short-subunit alcohol dehydrogenase family)